MYKDVSLLIDHSRLRTFPSVLIDFVSSLCRFDSTTILVYKESFKPVVVYPSDPLQQSAALKYYLDKAYILDPFFSVINSANPPEVCRLNDLAPDSFERTEYFKSCYREFNLADEINIIVRLSHCSSFAICLGRYDSLGAFTRAELNRLKDIYPLVDSLVRQFWLSNSQEYAHYERTDGLMKRALNTFGGGVLTRREQQICGLTLQGLSSKVIARKLHISEGTVKVHRKNIHTRLDTSTQSEVFVLFLQHLSSIESSGEDVRMLHVVENKDEIKTV